MEKENEDFVIHEYRSAAKSTRNEQIDERPTKSVRERGPTIVMERNSDLKTNQKNHECHTTRGLRTSPLHGVPKSSQSFKSFYQVHSVDSKGVKGIDSSGEASEDVHNHQQRSLLNVPFWHIIHRMNIHVLADIAVHVAVFGAVSGHSYKHCLVPDESAGVTCIISLLKWSTGSTSPISFHFGLSFIFSLRGNSSMSWINVVIVVGIEIVRALECDFVLKFLFLEEGKEKRRNTRWDI